MPTLRPFERTSLSANGAPTAAGSIVMAGGIFGLGALQQMPLLRHALTQPLTIGLFAVWVLIANSYVSSWRRGRFDDHVRPPIGRFAIGSWVAATAVLVRMLILAYPTWRPVAVLLWALACGTWLWFVIVVTRGFGHLVERSRAQLVPGVVLLFAVSTQSVALAAFDLTAKPSEWSWAAAILSGVGAGSYLVGLALMVRSHFSVDSWSLADDWDNSNCILHGALSITGLTFVTWNAAPPHHLQILWVVVFFIFLAVEAVEIARLVIRVRAYGWRRGAFSYNVTQWSRIFTFGMFYAFTLGVAHHSASAAMPPWMVAMQAATLTYGAPLLLFFLLAEAALCLRSHVRAK
ncbi:MAG: hypothetical protein AB7O49_04590 [Sphingomonadales bacterium]